MNDRIIPASGIVGDDDGAFLATVTERKVLLPVMLTPRMHAAFMREFYRHEKHFDLARCYHAMIDAHIEEQQ